MDQIKDKIDEECKTILIGNKVDLFKVIKHKLMILLTQGTINKVYSRTLISLEIQNSLLRNKVLKLVIKMKHSAKTGECLDEAFRRLARSCYDSLKNEYESNANYFGLRPQEINNPKYKCFEKFTNLLNPMLNFFSKKEQTDQNKEIKQIQIQEKDKQLALLNEQKIIDNDAMRQAKQTS